MAARSKFSALWVALACLTATACTSVDYDFTSATPAAKDRPYGDSDPVYDWEGGAPFGFDVHGIDVAKYQGTIDWPTVKRGGIAFAFIKATEGGDLLDTRFMENWAGAKRAGVPRSAYHFFYFCTSARKQAQWFIRNVPRDRSALPHVLDMEWNPKSPTCKLRPPAAKVRSEMKIFLDRIERHYGKRPIIYTTVDFYRDNIKGHLKDEVFWLRSVKAHPKVTYPGRPWAFWQYTGTGIVPGIKGDTDINVFAGTRAQWREWVKRVTK